MHLSQNKAKLIIVGPAKSGKTTLANFLSDAGDSSSTAYRPTKGCRIVEFEVLNVQIKSIPSGAEVELWDVSGDKRFASCWPIIQRGANGVIFVYNAGNNDHPRILESLHTQFVGQQGIRDTQCVVFCLSKPDDDGYRARLSNVFNGVRQVDSDFSEVGRGKLRQDFNEYLGEVLSHMSEMSEKNENYILQ